MSETNLDKNCPDYQFVFDDAMISSIGEGKCFARDPIFDRSDGNYERLSCNSENYQQCPIYLDKA